MVQMDRADRHSRLVRWLKVALPLAALAILSTLFFVAETLDPEAAIPYAEVDVERILRDQGMTQPTFGAVTSDGVQISLEASAVKPGIDRRSRFTSARLSADLNFPGRGVISIESPEGIIDTESGLAVLQGGARLKSSTGYVVTTESIVTSYTQATALAEEPVQATSPAGQVNAGSMELRQHEKPEDGYLLVFKNGVKLVYDPKT